MKSLYPPAAPLPQTPAERIIFSNAKVVVSASRLEVGGHTFAIARLNSARMQRLPAEKRIAGIMIGAGLGCGIFSATAFWLQLSGVFLSPGQFLLIAVLSFIIAAVGAILLITSRITYGLIVATPSGDFRALTGDRGGEIAQYVAAVNQAISMHARERKSPRTRSAQ